MVGQEWDRRKLSDGELVSELFQQVSVGLGSWLEGESGVGGEGAVVAIGGAPGDYHGRPAAVCG